MNQTAPETIDAYIAAFPNDVQAILQQVRMTIHEAAPEAVEAIKYQIPTYVLNGNLVSFAGYKTHIGMYPVPGGDEAFKAEVAAYVAGKGTLQFPLDKPIPYELISRSVKFRVEETLANAEAKKKR